MTEPDLTPKAPLVREDEHPQFERTMKARHLIMLSLGGVIGTGLFFNTGFVIGETGAFGTVVAYLIGALVVYLVMLSMGELCLRREAFTSMRRPSSDRARASRSRGSTG